MVKNKTFPEGKFGRAEKYIKSLVIDSEFKTAKRNNEQQYVDYESILDMIELVRSEKNYDWQSDIFIGLLLSHMLTDTATWAAQDFQSRDFTDIYLEGNQPGDKEKAKAAKTLLNCLLNIKEVYHFHKRIRGRTIGWMFGQVYALMWWDQKIVKKTVQPSPISTIVRDVDENGNVVPRMIKQEQPPVTVENIIADHVNYDVFDARNVFTDNSYCYSAQQKSFITLRSEKRWSNLNSDADKFGYINIDVLKEKIFGGDKNRKIRSTTETETSRESFNKMGGAYSQKTEIFNKVDPELDVLDRYGSIWAVVKERDEDELPIVIEPGYSEDGGLLDAAELVEAIITYAGIGGDYTLIGFRPTWAIDAKGVPYKPIIRGWCYIHPTKDIGLSDGKNLREMNVAANDTFNASNDRVMMATFPTLKGRRDAIENNPTVFMAPQNLILLEDVDRDLKEMEIRDNVAGALNQLAFVKATASEMDAIYPTTMGGLPEKTSTTAMAIGGAENRTNTRSNLKALTQTYTFDVEFYQMILQMTYRNMRMETLKKILGPELTQYFDPNCDYTFVPISANIESEHQKLRKVQTWDQIMGRLSGLAKVSPQGIIPIISMIVGEQCMLMGSEFREVKHLLDNLNKAPINQEGKGAEQVKDSAGQPTSNQYGMEQTTGEMAARGNI